MVSPLRSGVHAELEAAADQLIKESLRGVTKHSEKSDVLTPWKEQERRRREIYVPSGVPEAHLRKGVFGRVTNPAAPHLNSRDGTAPGRRVPALYDGIPSTGTPREPSRTVRWDDE